MFQNLQSGLVVNHLGKKYSTGVLSPRLWDRITSSSMASDGAARLVLVGDDFMSFGGTVTSNVGTYAGAVGGYTSYEDTGASIAQRADQKGGVIRITTDGTDNDEAWLQSCGGAGVLGSIATAVANAHLTVFEARVKFGQISDTYNAFIGLAEEGSAAADFVSDAGAIGNKDQIGFQVLEGSTLGAKLKFVWKKAGQTAVTLYSTLQTLVAGTYYNLGFVYDPSAPLANRLAVYVDNAEKSTYGTYTQLSAATFPDGEGLAFLAGVKNGTTAATYIDVDGWAFGQVIR